MRMGNLEMIKSNTNETPLNLSSNMNGHNLKKVETFVNTDYNFAPSG